MQILFRLSKVRRRQVVEVHFGVPHDEIAESKRLTDYLRFEVKTEEWHGKGQGDGLDEGGLSATMPPALVLVGSMIMCLGDMVNGG